MYPTLYHAVKDLFGWDIPGLQIVMTFGFFVALAFVAAYLAMTAELRRKEKNGELKAVERKRKKSDRNLDYLSNAGIGFFVGWKLVYLFLNIDKYAHDPQSYLLSGEGSLLWGLVIALAFVGYKYYLYRKEDQLELSDTFTFHPYQLMGNITVLAAGLGFLGAKIFHHLEYWDEFIQDPIAAITSPFSGLTFFGGLIFGGAAVLWYANKHGIKPLKMLDVGAPAMMLGYGVGRMGCHFSGDGDWGTFNLNPKPDWLSWLPDWAWAYDYPNNVLGEVLEHPVWPTPLYEVIMALGLFAVLWSIRKRLKVDGLLFSWYLIFSGIERFLIEKIRVNSKYNVGGLEFTQAELISGLFIILGITAIVLLNRRAKQRAELDHSA